MADNGITHAESPAKESPLDGALEELVGLTGVTHCIDIVTANLESAEMKRLPEIEALGYLCAQLHIHVRALKEHLTAAHASAWRRIEH